MTVTHPQPSIFETTVVEVGDTRLDHQGAERLLAYTPVDLPALKERATEAMLKDGWKPNEEGILVRSRKQKRAPKSR